jgi:hypothetical protein
LAEGRQRQKLDLVANKLHELVRLGFAERVLRFSYDEKRLFVLKERYNNKRYMIHSACGEKG